MIQHSFSVTGTLSSMQNHSPLSAWRAMATTFACFTLLGFSPHSFAWGKDGHTAIGILAVEQIRPDALRELENIMDPLTKEAMDKACNWPDVIRETEEGKWSSPLHYINIPRDEAVYLQSRDCPEKPGLMTHGDSPTRHCATEAIKYFAADLSKPQASRERRRQAFAWLCHLVGDLHQPLHAGFADDRGGNDTEVVFNDKEINLHHFWDSALINQEAGSWQYLVGELGEFPPVQAGLNWSPEMVDDWTSESHQLAKRVAYPAGKTIETTFANQSWNLTQQQIKQAASRLALIINSLLTPATTVEH